MASGAADRQSAHLAGLALQADLGDRSETSTFRPEDYVPHGMRGPAALRAVEVAHARNRGLGRNEARARLVTLPQTVPS